MQGQATSPCIHAGSPPLPLLLNLRWCSSQTLAAMCLPPLSPVPSGYDCPVEHLEKRLSLIMTYPETEDPPRPCHLIADAYASRQNLLPTECASSVVRDITSALVSLPPARPLVLAVTSL